MPLDAKIRSGLNPKLEVAKKLGELVMMAMAANPGNVIAMAPPLIVTRAEIDEGIEIGAWVPAIQIGVQGCQ